MKSGTVRRRSARNRFHSRGVSLIELMVALVIGLFMIGGAVAVYLKARDTYAATEVTSRLQENARYAMGIIESDVRMANFWGLTNRPDFVTTNGASTSIPATCGTTWATDVSNFVTGTNNTYSVTCAAQGGGAQTSADVLIVRHASAQRLAQAATVAAPNTDRVLIITSRTSGQIFVPKDITNAIPSGFATTDPVGQPPLADTRQLLVNTYYVSQDSSVATGYPALRRKFLNSGPVVADEELLPGVEDLQFQIGVDTSGDANADVFVNPGSVPAGGAPVSVRIWLRLRAPDIDVGFTDNKAYTYADRTVSAPGDRYRRLLVSKTIQLRNVRP